MDVGGYHELPGVAGDRFHRVQPMTKMRDRLVLSYVTLSRDLPSGEPILGA